MIATCYEHVVEAKVETEHDQNELKHIHKGDLSYDVFKQVYLIHHPERYREVPFIARAIEDRQKQLALFE